MTEKCMLIDKLRTYSFALKETNLYLDAYPDSQNAIDYFIKTRRAYESVLKEYTEKYGPLTYYNGVSDGKWVWVNGPWPWMKEANE